MSKTLLGLPDCYSSKPSREVFTITGHLLSTRNGFISLTPKQLQVDGVVITSLGAKVHIENGAIHKADGPAITFPDGETHYCRKGLLHNEKGAAMQCANGDKFFFIDGCLSKKDGPAVQMVNGREEYWVDGVIGNGDEPAIITEYEDLEYWVDGKRSCDFGPAVITSGGAEEYWLNGNRNNIDGPAYIDEDGLVMYYINDRLHNEKGPSVISPDSPNGKQGEKMFYWEGERLEQSEWAKHAAEGFSKDSQETIKGELDFQFNDEPSDFSL